MTTSDSLRLAREASRGLPHMGGELPRCAVDLSDNTNLWGAPPAAVRTLSRARGDALSRYPALYSEPLQAALLAYVGLRDASGISVVTGCGSDDVLDSTMRAFGESGERIAFSSPTFSMIPVMARLNGLDPVAIPLTSSFDLDVERLVDARAKITYVCAPNNPTATSVSRAAVEYVLEHADGIVLVDEAYAEFAPDVFVDLVARFDRLIVARTFSKAFGLAGLRIGYGVASTDIARHIERARGPYKVGRLAEEVVAAVLEPTPEGLDWVRAHAALAIENRDRLCVLLGDLGLVVLPSAANFVMVPDARARNLAAGLRERGVGVRWFGGLPLAIPEFAQSKGTALRIGVGPWGSMERLVGALTAVLACV
ncbi:MAG: histidinol-phosphate aminotransferase family protein [Gemmatimonadota bacterium]|nr:histidinol-phosphate aminotransferase family protein [Gemmatimonadota bacterium]